MADIQPPVPPDVFAGLLAPLISAATGVAMRHAERLRERKTFDWRQVVVDLPLLAGAFIGGPAIAEVMGWGPRVACGVTLFLGYVGTRALDALWVKLQAALVAKVES